jgi:hypothetical protein
LKREVEERATVFSARNLQVMLALKSSCGAVICQREK